jgi:predicted permease
MGQVYRDIRSAVRVLRRSPGFVAIALAVLTFGIGANTAVFSIFNALVLRTLPVPEPERLVELFGNYRNGSSVPFSFPAFKGIERGQRVFSGLFGRSGIYQPDVDVDGTLFRTHVQAVTENYYAELGATPVLGRLIGVDDRDRPVAVIAYRFWKRRFGLESTVIGSKIRLHGQSFTIVGVTREWFTGVTPGQTPEITIPVTVAPPFSRESRSMLWVHATGRLKKGVTIEQARGQLSSFWPDVLAATVPTNSPGERRRSYLSMGLEVESAATGVREGLSSQLQEPLQVLIGLAGLLLVVGCLNLASLLLARAAMRRQEMSTRLALGASRWRIFRQLATEAGLLSAAGAVPALLFAYWASRSVLGLLSQGASTPVVLDVGVDWRVFLFAAFVLALTTVLVGALPAWLISRDAACALLNRRGPTRGPKVSKLGKALVVAQIAISIVLVQGAGLLLRTLDGLKSFDPGFNKSDVITMTLRPRPERDKNLNVGEYRRQLLERLSELPPVRSVAQSSLSVATDEDAWSDTVSLAGDSSADGEWLTRIAFVSPRFFETLSIPLVAGRDFDWLDDAERRPLAILDSDLARRLLSSGDVIGRHVRFGVQPGFEHLEIVGVVGSARLVDLRDANAHMIYVPSLQHPRFGQGGKIYVRASNSAGLVGAIENQIASFGHDYLAEANTLQRISDEALHRERATTMLAGFVACMALLLVGIGLFGLIAYTVVQRTREFGIRMALGSQRASIVRMVIGDALLLSLAGVVIGLPCGIAVARLAAHTLFGVSPADPATMLAAVVLLVSVAAVAGYLPSRRVARMDPLVALRHE